MVSLCAVVLSTHWHSLIWCYHLVSKPVLFTLNQRWKLIREQAERLSDKMVICRIGNLMAGVGCVVIHVKV